MIDLTPIANAIIAVVAVAITAYLVPWIKNRTTAAQREEINAWVKIAVQAAEQLHNVGQIQNRKAYVLQFLAQRQVKVNMDELDKLIKQHEGCRLKAYRCPAGVWTIGYGHTGMDVKPGQAITQAKAEQLLRQDLHKFKAHVMKFDSQYDWNQNEFDALVSFAFNVGSINQLTAKKRGQRHRSRRPYFCTQGCW